MNRCPTRCTRRAVTVVVDHALDAMSDIHERHWEFEKWQRVFDSVVLRKELVNRELRGIIRRRKG